MKSSSEGAGVNLLSKLSGGLIAVGVKSSDKAEEGGKAVTAAMQVLQWKWRNMFLLL